MKTKNKGATEKLKVTWFGHSAFLLETPEGKRVLIDPWLDNPKAPAGAKEISAVDLILITHGHADHVGNAVELAQQTSAKVIGIHEISLYLKSRGVENVTGMNKGGTVEVDGLSVTMTDARHSGDIDVGETVIPGGEPAGYVIEFQNGYRVYHAGDTSLFGDMKLIGQLLKPNVALLPIGGLYTMGPRDAAQACKLINAARVIGMHYGTFPPLAGTPEELKKNLPAAMRKRVLELEIGIPVSLS